MSLKKTGVVVVFAITLSALTVTAVTTYSKQAEARPSRDYIDYNSHRTGHFKQGRTKNTAVRNGTLRLSSPKRKNGRFVGTFVSPRVTTKTRFDTLVPSWQGATPRGTLMKVQVKIRQNGTWSDWLRMGRWDSRVGGIQSSTTKGQSWGRWSVYTDTIQARGRYFANAYQYRVVLVSNRKGRSPRLREFDAVASNSYRHGNDRNIPALKRAWGKRLNVPRRSQYNYDGGGEVWCSPTSITMVMAYFNKTLPVPYVARGTYDRTYRGWGNWAFNTAFASSRGFDSSVTRFSNIAQAERWIDRGIPVTASIAWNNNKPRTRLNRAPLRASNGHLLVIVGFTRRGDVIVNDPAGSPRSNVRRVYDRQQFNRAWMKTGSGGVAYVIKPENRRDPVRYASHGSW